MELLVHITIRYSSKAKNMSIDPAEEFLKHAAECKRMAKFARAYEDKAAWVRMAERWQRCAESFYSQTIAALSHHSTTQNRPRGFKSYHH
jgi:hypothetical protein